MRVALFYHSLLSDWNHGNAHFLRGLVSELKARGHAVRVFEPAGNWSLTHQLAEGGREVLTELRRVYPGLRSIFYDPRRIRRAARGLLQDCDLAIVHEWNDPAVVAAIGRCRRDRRTALLFHDTHHRSLTDPRAMRAMDLSGYDGVLAFGNVIRDAYLRRRWAKAAWTWHEAADVRVFRPRGGRRRADLVWIGNWGDEERTAELHEFLIEPVRRLGLRATVYGVRYPDAALRALEKAGIEYRGWLPNFAVPKAFAEHRLTVHIPRRPYAAKLAGVPTIRVFEALACGMPLVCSPWHDVEGLFRPGRDYLIAADGRQMTAHLRRLLAEPQEARAVGARGRETVLQRHTCAHRVDQLIEICRSLGKGGVK